MSLLSTIEKWIGRYWLCEIGCMILLWFGKLDATNFMIITCAFLTGGAANGVMQKWAGTGQPEPPKA